jgi:hypothetical protein
VVAPRTAAEHRISRWVDRMAAEGLTVAAARAAGGRAAAIAAEVLVGGSYGSIGRAAVAVLRERAPVASCCLGAGSYIPIWSGYRSPPWRSRRRNGVAGSTRSAW